jgi:phosphatidyl-myo-inositol dimannoside synthase
MVANSNYTRQRSIRQDKVFESAHVCWLATSEDEPPEPPALLDGPPVVLIHGRRDDAAYKGHKELIETWPAVVKGVPEARLIIVGGGPFIDRYRAMAASSEAARFIEIAGFVTESVLPTLWRRAVVFAMPSRGEGFGLAYIEAMRWKIPVIASVHDAGAEVNIHDETGFNVDLTRPRDLRDSLVELLRDRDLARRLGAAGQGRWREHFCYSAFRARFSGQLNGFVAS